MSTSAAIHPQNKRALIRSRIAAHDESCVCTYARTLPTDQRHSRSTHANSLLMSVIYYHRLFVALFLPRFHAPLDESLITFQQSMAATEIALRKSARMRLIVPRGPHFSGPRWRWIPQRFVKRQRAPRTSRSIDRSTTSLTRKLVTVSETMSALEFPY